MALRRITAGLVAATALALAVTGCGTGKTKILGSDSTATWKAPTFEFSPANKATDVPVSAEIEVKGIKIPLGLEVSGPNGAVAGTQRVDRSTWVPDEPLEFNTTYTLRIGDETSTFTTMSRPTERVTANVNVGDGQEYGQAMPIMLTFADHKIPQDQRAAIEKRLFVTSNPPQIGSWRWINSNHLEYRPQEYWKPGTAITARYALGGLPLGDGAYGATDITSHFTIDDEVRKLVVDNDTKTMDAYRNGSIVKSIPVSLGKAKTPSSSGNMVIMEKLAKTIFDSSTYGVPNDSPEGYRTEIQYAQRMTWGGEFIHAAPWSVADQGVRNVSHGCTNVSLANAEWVYQFTKIGDPIIVKGTERQLQEGNGWTAWNLSWEEFVKGSALWQAS